MILSVPFFDGTEATQKEINMLMLPLIGGAFVALLTAWGGGIPPVLNVDFWHVERRDAITRELVWVSSNTIGALVVGAIFAVASYGFALGYLTSAASDTSNTVYAVIAGVLAATLLIYSFVNLIAYGKASGQLSLRYALLILFWAVTLPLLYRIVRPWNIILIEVLLVLAYPLLFVLLARVHARLLNSAFDTHDLRINTTEANFRRHILRWTIFCAFNGSVYLVAYVADDSTNFTTVLTAVLIAQVVFLLTVLLLELLCLRKSTAEVFVEPTPVLPVTVSAPAVTKPPLRNAAAPAAKASAATSSDDSSLGAFNLNKPKLTQKRR